MKAETYFKKYGRIYGLTTYFDGACYKVNCFRNLEKALEWVSDEPESYTDFPGVYKPSKGKRQLVSYSAIEKYPREYTRREMISPRRIYVDDDEYYL